MDPSKDNIKIDIDMNSHIDTLLERYLSLLDEYTTLRETLNGLQRDIYQGIARANFSADRGIRYGADHYDERMQATRKVDITSSKSYSSSKGAGIQDGDGDGDGEFRISVKTETPPHSSPSVKSEEEKDVKKDGDEGKGEDGAGKLVEDTAEKDNQDLGYTEKSASNKENEKKKKSNDPLRWFGLLTPLPLRQAQANAIKAVEEIIPRLASVNMAMAEVELEVRRARKKRAKAVAAAEKAGKAEAVEQLQAAA